MKKLATGFRQIIFLTSFLCVAISTANLFAALGTVRNILPFQSFDFVSDPLQPHVYASVWGENRIAVINSKSALEVGSISLPGSPVGMAFSLDGQTLYVANSSHGSIDVIETQSLSLTRSINLGGRPSDVAVGLDNRLYVLDTESFGQIKQIDAVTGNSTGPSLGGGAFIYSGNLQIAPDLKTLYYGQWGLSPTTLYAFDVSSTSPALLRSIQTGSNGHAVALSTDGKLIAQPNGAPYSVALLRASDFATVGNFPTGAYPNDLAFSPNGALAYVSHYVYPTQIDVYNTATSANVGHFPILDTTNAMSVDRSGRNLFVSYQKIFNNSTGTYIYDTGIPEPSAIAMATVAAGALLVQRTRKRE